MSEKEISYGEAIRAGFAHLLDNHPEVFVMGQGLWSPWYVGNSMTELEEDYGDDRVIDTPISELACTGAAVGASLCGYKPIIVHPRMDFMILATDTIVNQAAKWHHMLGGQSSPSVTVRGIINRGGEQGAQHSQALHSWYAHIPGLRVVMPYTVKDARDLLVAATLCPDPVLYIDDRWLYEQKDELGEPEELNLAKEGPNLLCEGSDVTLVGAGYSVALCMEAARELEKKSISADVIDLRVINPLEAEKIVASVRKTGRLVAVDGGWTNCGLAAEVLARVAEAVPPSELKSISRRVTLTDAPAPTSKPLEDLYYPKVDDVLRAVEKSMKG